MGKAWQGRLPGGTDARVERFTESISFDHRLYREDIRQSIAHATMLGEVGILTADEAKQLCDGLSQIEKEIAAGEFVFDATLEDIHLNIETALIARLGDVGRKLHTARSRNDQVATDLKLWTRNQLDRLDVAVVTVQKALLNSATANVALVVPGYTHMQRAQPVLLAHLLLAHVEKYERDRSRIADCRRRLNWCPLGAAALAGTSLPIDRNRSAALLGFDGPTANSIDSVSDRDFVVEAVFVLATIAGHLSSWAEEWILWTTTEFDFLRLPDAFCTGSSIMPQKKNPDVLELIRGKSARVIGALQTLLVLTKGLPLAYNRDLQEDKPPLFDAMETVQTCLELAAPTIEGAEYNVKTIAERLDRGHLDATTLMERLIVQGVPMRSAHEIVGKLVRECLHGNCRLEDLSDATLAGSMLPLVPTNVADLRTSLGVKNSINAFQSYGSTAPGEVKKQLAAWQKRLGSLG